MPPGNQTVFSVAENLKLKAHIAGLFLGFMLLAGLVSGQSMGSGGIATDAQIELKGYEFKGSFVVINYEIPYNGVVEIRLFDQGGDKVWQGQYAHNHGENRIVLKRGKFNPGEKYAFVLNYKKDEVRESMLIPPGNY